MGQTSHLEKHLKKTPLQMLLRGQNILGYRHYADDVVENLSKNLQKTGLIFSEFSMR